MLVRNDKILEGIKVEGTEFRISQYADDTVLFLNGTEKPLQAAFKILDLFASMSGFGASAIWRTRHNDSYIVHAWEEYNREVKEKHYLYYTDWQVRTPLGDDGERVRVEVPTVV